MGGDRNAHTLSEDVIDNVCRALADRHRRRILGYLMATDDGMATLDELHDRVSPISPHSSKRLRIALHNHLGILDEAGIIEYDQRSNTARFHGHQSAEAVLVCVEAASAYNYRSPSESAEG